MEEPSDDAIVTDVAGRPDASDNKHSVVFHAHTFDVLSSSSPQALNAIDLLCHFFGCHDDGENGISLVATAEVEGFRLKCPKQRSIAEFFSAMSRKASKVLVFYSISVTCVVA